MYKDVLKFIDNFERAAADFAETQHVDGAVCGHIHSAKVRKIGTIDYYNAGDWVESCTALGEDFDGTIKLIRCAEFHRESKISEAVLTMDESNPFPNAV
jgi:UDP-2,3-diacylglucosamine pyrophosphatase LpxH